MWRLFTIFLFFFLFRSFDSWKRSSLALYQKARTFDLDGEVVYDRSFLLATTIMIFLDIQRILLFLSFLLDLLVFHCFYFAMYN
jgi:hypothetical protein